jgi:hypothetical protein
LHATRVRIFVGIEIIACLDMLSGWLISAYCNSRTQEPHP